MYNYGTVLTKVSIVHADRNTPSFMRSPAETPYVYALENAMDEMAQKLGIDPVEFRRLNDTQIEPIGKKPFSSRSLMQCFDEAAAAFGWSERDSSVGAMRDGDWLVGMGCASAIYPTNVATCAARVRLTADGRMRVQTASHEIGTGVRTIAAQMAAERLGVSVDGVEVEMGDSSLPPAPVAGGSNSTASVCSTIIKACDQIRLRLVAAATEPGAGPLAGANASAIVFEEAALKLGSRKLTLEDAFKLLGAGAIE
jgi:xanthine dehydrogenase YagR molybdenum-binding subunit